ncbi:MAG: diguanylate cyclase, partial [Myxococcota bacterium]
MAAAPKLSPASTADLDPNAQVEISEHWSADEIASFVCHPGSGRVLTVRPGGHETDGLEHVLEDAGYRIGRLPITRDTSHLPHAAATFMPHVIYVTLSQPMQPCLEALELLGHDARTRDVPLVALIGEGVEPEAIEDAYTRSGCDFLRSDATAIESLARTHLLTRLATAIREGAGGEGEQVRLHQAPRAGAANDDPRAPLLLLDRDSGAYSARYFAQRLPAEIARATRYKRELSVMMVRCPAAAESSAVAAKITARLREYCRETDLIARADGPRFVVLLPETPGQGATALADRVAEALASDGLDADTKVLAAEAPGLARILGG